MKTIVVGLGNPILGDDGVGWKVAEEVKEQFNKDRPEGGRCVDVEFLSLGGLSLMEHLIGYERAILVDAVASDRPPGSVVVSKLGDLPDYSGFHTASPHDTSLQNALRLGRTIGAKLPDVVIVVGIATSHIFDFSEELSPAVAEAVSEATQIVIHLLP